ncbi:MAG: hypothetical protein KJZ65_01680 [Phycisphaerales bacterium]|nr:hypothetical protein [Phycisphaerales bacterium]
MPFKRYILVMTLLLGLSCLSIAAFNLAVDPYGAYPWASVKWLHSRSGEKGTRTARAELLRRGPWEFIILGSSRAQMGYAPDHPVLGGMKGCNAALPATNIRELQPVVDYALRHNDPKRILFAIDFLLFDGGRGFQHDFAQSYFTPGRDAISYHLDNTISFRATNASYKALMSALRGERPRFTALGQTVRHTKKLSDGHRALFAAKLTEFFAETYADLHTSPDRLERFRQIIQAVHAEGVPLDIVINPIHAAQLEAIATAGLWTEFEQWLRDVTLVVEGERQISGANVRLVSFIGYAPYCDEPIPAPGDTETTMRYWWESSHCKDELGGLVLERLYAPGTSHFAPGFGVDLTTGNIEQYLADLNTARQIWVEANPGDVAFVCDLARKAGLLH